MFSNYKFEIGTVVEFNFLLYNRNENFITEETNFSAFEIKGKNNLIRLEDFKKTISNFLKENDINFEIEKATVAIRTSQIATETFIWTFKLQSIECFALISVDRNSKIIGLSFGEVSNKSLRRNSFSNLIQFRVRQHDRRSYSFHDQDNMLLYSNSNAILLNDFYYFLKYFGEFKENYLNFKNKKKLKTEFSKKIFRVKIAKLVKEFFNVDVKFHDDGAIVGGEQKIDIGNDTNMVFFMSDRDHIITLALHVENHQMFRQQFSTSDSLETSMKRLNQTEAFFKIIRSGNK